MILTANEKKILSLSSGKSHEIKLVGLCSESKKLLDMRTVEDISGPGMTA